MMKTEKLNQVFGARHLVVPEEGREVNGPGYTNTAGARRRNEVMKLMAGPSPSASLVK